VSAYSKFYKKKYLLIVLCYRSVVAPVRNSKQIFWSKFFVLIPFADTSNG